MKFAPKRLLNRLLGHGPCAAQAFDELFPTAAPGENRVLASVPADDCTYAPTPALLGQRSAMVALSGKVPSPERRLFSLRDAGIAGVDGVVYCPGRRLAVAETVQVWLQPADAHPLFSAPRFPRAQPLPGRTLSLGSIGAEGFYHFLIESLPRLEVARGRLADIDHVLAPGSPGSFQEKWLVLAGVPREKILWLEGHTHYRCEELLFTGPLSRDCEPTPWLVEAIGRAVNHTRPARGTRRLWISRRDASIRHLAWENALLALLPQFQRVELAALAPAEQIALFGEAAVVAGPHGAGLANLVFCPLGATVIEFHPDRDRPVFARLAAAAQCRHVWTVLNFQNAPENLSIVAGAIQAAAR